MNIYNDDTLFRILWNLDQTMQRITEASRYIGAFQNNAKESYRVWRENLRYCKVERKLLFLYVLNDVLQVYRNTPVSEEYSKELGTVMYEVIRENPVLIDKVNHIVEVWRNRGVISTDKLVTVEDAIRRAFNEYSNGSGKRPSPNPSSYTQSSNEQMNIPNFPNFDMNEGFINTDTYDMDPEPNTLSDDSIPPPQDKEEEEEAEEVDREHLTNSFIASNHRITEMSSNVSKLRDDLYSLPDWVVSTEQFSSILSSLLEDVDETDDSLYDAMHITIDFEKLLGRLLAERKRSRDYLEEIRKAKRKLMTTVTAALEETAKTVDLLHSLGEEEEIVQRVPRNKPTSSSSSLQVSSEVLAMLQRTMEEVKEEEARKEREKEEQTRKQRELQDMMSKGMMKSGAEELRGKSWNTRGLFDRILWCVCCKQKTNGEN